ncbi:glutamine--fructose-6-phosphate transaminase (isomerizing) [Pontibacter sp. G13]|uniref:glutamine--fructose-6-phosphate transaminase (isomerizing) n=1 Tax=Pontibacter sp. G13 TaxID=3074898 RepID=UPI002889CE8A|nr:glutamine--fructose-6-phosphate transaminase (isomerizing) [Pontibacter sp. G13]WNJ16191.1 glutamine--fructose-6-phosphate transaminase (isomerizing) [Pontibacter sp. G13]
MCGIVGYIGYRDAYPILIDGLKRLEYRGYDSAGVALMNGSINLYKKQGKVADLESHVGAQSTDGHVGMGHTRWATHGEPNDINAHPHCSASGNFALIHNGIIENYSSLKAKLTSKGYTFQSGTDTEVLVQLIEMIYSESEVTPEEAVRLALNEVVGAYGIIVMCQDEPGKLIVARKSSPIVIGIAENEYVIASDATPIIAYTKDVIYLNDDEMAILTKDSHTIKTIGNEIRTPFLQRVEMELEELEKGGYDYFMLKEIFEQPKSIADSIRGRINPNDNSVWLGGLVDVHERLKNAKRFIFVACGTSWHAGLVGEYLFEEYARVPVEVEYASEFRYRNPIITEDDVVIAISQSGETADTLAAVQIAKTAGALVLGVVNAVGSTISRETHAGVYIHAGPEIGVASTKAFTSQVTVLSLMAAFIAQLKGISSFKSQEVVNELLQIPEKVRTILETNEDIIRISDLFKDSSNFLYLGRGYNFPVALEGALKLKEISYIHAEGYPAAEMKHGPIALIDENMPVVFIATHDESYDKIVSNVDQVVSRKGRVIAVVTEGDETIRNLAEFVIEIPKSHPSLMPLLSVIPLQLLSYHVAVMRGCNVDQPRNLAKSVTVE